MMAPYLKSTSPSRPAPPPPDLAAAGMSRLGRPDRPAAGYAASRRRPLHDRLRLDGRHRALTLTWLTGLYPIMFGVSEMVSSFASQIRVIDSAADLCYLVLPRRLAATEDMTESELAALVTQDSMIGVTEALSPADR